MSEVISIELFVYLVTALCALLLVPRSSNWRLRLLIGTVGLQSLAHAAAELRNHHPFWQSRLSHLTGVIEMFGGALALTAIYLLKRENRDRKSTDARLRLSEAAVPPETPSKAASPEAMLALVNATAPVAEQDGGKVAAPDGPLRDALQFARVRQDRRYPLSGELEITILGAQKEVVRAQCADISKGGARFLVHDSIPPETLVQVMMGEHLFLGEVRYCEFREGEGRHSVGIKFDQVLDLRRLADILKGNGMAPAGVAEYHKRPIRQPLAG